MSVPKEFRKLINSISSILDKKTAKPLLQYLRVASETGTLDREELNDFLCDMELSTDQLEKVYSVIWDFSISLPIVNRLTPDPLDEETEDDISDEPDEELQFDVSSGIDGDTLYRKKVLQIEPLTLQEEIQCGKQIIAGRHAEETLLRAKENGEKLTPDNVAELELAVKCAEMSKMLLVERNLPIVLAIVKKYLNKGSSYGDLIQDGNLGLMEALEGYDYRKGYRFNTYASFWVHRRIRIGLMTSTKQIRLPAHYFELYVKIYTFSQKYALENGHDPNIKEIASEIDLSEEMVESVINSMRPIIELDSPFPVSDEPSSLTQWNNIQDDESNSPEIRSEHSDLRSLLNENMTGLSIREIVVINLRFGLENGHRFTLEEVGAELGGLSRERVRQIEKKAMMKMKDPQFRKKVAEYMR